MAQREEGLQPRRRREPVLRQASPLEEIRLSCLKGNLQSVQRIIEAGVASVNEVFDDGWTALMVASNGAHPQLVQFLLEHNGDPNICRPDGFSPLMAALTSSQRDDQRIEAVTELLVKSGAKINVHNKAGLSPLLLAIKDKKIPIFKFLILSGADVNAKDKDGRTPLFYAVERGLKEISQFLLDSGADISSTDQNGQTLSQIAEVKGHNELADILRPSPNPKGISKDENPIPEPVHPALEPFIPVSKEKLAPEAEPVLHVFQACDDATTETVPPVISSIPKKNTVSEVKKADKPIPEPPEKNSEKKPEKKSLLAYGLALGIGVGVIFLYYVRTYYLKRI